MASGDERQDELDALAGEYVLGTLDAAERTAVDARLQREPDLAAAVDAWAARLAPLDENIAPATPPASQFEEIMRSLDAPETGGADIVALRGQVSRWRFASIATGAIAAALALFMVFTNLPTGTVPQGPKMVAYLQDKDQKLHYLASTDAKSGKLVLKRLGGEPASGKSHELWAIGGGRDKPESLGVINARHEVPLGRIGPATPDYLGGITLAVSLEPAGGSPTGQPTGPVLLTGKFVELPQT